MPLVVGIDEAGRGPVIGPMVLAAVAIEVEKLDALADLGVDDSKKLTAKKREALFDPVQQMVADFRIIEVSPAEIDAAVDGGGGMDRLEARVAAHLIGQLMQAAPADAPVATAYVDAVGRGGHTHRERIAAALGASAPALVVENKADQRYPVVSAASILAKVTRDRCIVELAETHGPLGSGYPGDPKTKAAVLAAARAHLQTGAPLPDYLRTSWATVSNAIRDLRQGDLF